MTGSIVFLSYVIIADVIEVDDEKIEAIKEWLFLRTYMRYRVFMA